jgi:hypothetical protein
MVGAAKAVGGGNGRSIAGAVAVEGVVESTGTGARGRGSEVAGRPTAIAAPAFGIAPGGRGMSPPRL